MSKPRVPSTAWFFVGFSRVMYGVYSFSYDPIEKYKKAKRP